MQLSMEERLYETEWRQTLREKGSLPCVISGEMQACRPLRKLNQGYSYVDGISSGHAVTSIEGLSDRKGRGLFIGLFTDGRAETEVAGDK